MIERDLKYSSAYILFIGYLYLFKKKFEMVYGFVRLQLETGYIKFVMQQTKDSFDIFLLWRVAETN